MTVTKEQRTLLVAATYAEMAHSACEDVVMSLEEDGISIGERALRIKDRVQRLSHELAVAHRELLELVP